MLDAPTHLDTDEQAAIYAAARSSSTNLMIEAFAGCGKTTTLEGIGREVRGTTLYLCFNKRNADEAALRMPYTCEVRTLNALGHRAWASKTYQKLVLDKDKTRNILRELIAEAPKSAQSVMWSAYHQIVDGVTRAKTFGYVPENFPQATSLLKQGAFHALLDEEPDDLVSDLIDAALSRSIKASFKGTIDFNDQVYMPAMFGGSFGRYPTVLVDEYQDLSPVNHALLQRIATGRLIGVGDRYQNIYGFRGAKAAGMQEAIAHYSMTTLPLSLTFRCPSAIVSHVHWRVPTFRALHQGGFVERPATLASDDITDDTTVICRNNAPLFRLAIKLFGEGRSATITGRDIGPRLLGIMRKLGPESLGRAQVLGLIDQWLCDRLAAESKSAEDLAACMRVFAEHGRDLGQAISYAEHVLKADGKVLLTTGHKAKGLEWPRVVHLDPWLVRGKHASEQDKNLDYVISTRSSDTLIEIDSEQIEW